MPSTPGSKRSSPICCFICIRSEHLPNCGGGGSLANICAGSSLSAQFCNSSTLALSNYDLAELLGSTPETVSKALGEFSRRGLIRHHRCQIEIISSESLAELVEGLISTRV
jgi:hypothetical protein